VVYRATKLAPLGKKTRGFLLRKFAVELEVGKSSKDVGTDVPLAGRPEYEGLRDIEGNGGMVG